MWCNLILIVTTHTRCACCWPLRAGHDRSCCRTTLTLPGGSTQTGFFAINFTLGELQTLQARQALPFRAQNTSAGHRYRCSAQCLLRFMQGQACCD